MITAGADVYAFALFVKQVAAAWRFGTGLSKNFEFLVAEAMAPLSLAELQWKTTLFMVGQGREHGTGEQTAAQQEEAPAIESGGPRYYGQNWNLHIGNLGNAICGGLRQTASQKTFAATSGFR